MSDTNSKVGKPVTFSLDGKTVEAQPGETIWQASARHGTDIPHLCYRGSDGYRADGYCRACMVEIEGERVLAASCIRTLIPSFGAMPRRRMWTRPASRQKRPPPPTAAIRPLR